MKTLCRFGLLAMWCIALVPKSTAQDQSYSFTLARYSDVDARERLYGLISKTDSAQETRPSSLLFAP